MKISAAKSSTAPIILAHGPEGIGKTSLMLKAPDIVSMFLEMGVPAGIKTPQIEIEHTYEGVLGGIRDLLNESHEFKALGIDTLDSYEPLVIDYVCRKNGWKNIETPPYGRGYVAADEEWRRFIRGITALRNQRGMTIFMTTHTEVISINEPRVPSYSSYVPKLHKRARGLICDACDAIFFLSHDIRTITDDNDRVRAGAGPQRQLFTEGAPSYTAKNRFATPSKIALPIDFSFDNDLARYWA